MAKKPAQDSEILAELERLKQEAVIKDSIILEYREALTDAHFKIALLNGKLKLSSAGLRPSKVTV